MTGEMMQRGSVLRNRGSKGLLALSMAAAMAVSAISAHAATLSWDSDANGANGATGGSGNWNLSLLNWYPGTGSTDIAWTDISATGTDTAVFGGSQGTIALSANLSAAEMIFTTAGDTLADPSAFVLTLGANGSGVGIDATALTSGTTTINAAITLGSSTGANWNVGGGSTLAVTGAITGAYNITAGGTGALALSGNNTSYTGLTTIANNAQLDINSINALGTGILTFTTGSVLDNTSGSAITDAGNNAIHFNGNATFVGSSDLNLGTGTVTLNANRTLTVLSHNLTIGGQITDNSGAFSLTKQGAGTLTLTAANSYTGGTVVNGGTVSLSTTGTLGDTAGTLTLGNGGLSISGIGLSANRSVASGQVLDNQGLDTITVAADPSHAATFTAASLGGRDTSVTTAPGGGMELYRGTNLGSAPANGVGTILFTTAPAVVSGTGANDQLANLGGGSLSSLNNTINAPVFRGGLADTSATGTGIGFATYDTTDGVRLLKTSEQLSVASSAAYTAAASSNNVLISNTSLAITGKQTNTLQINNTSVAAGITITNSGAALNPTNGLLFTGSDPITLSGGSLIGSNDIILMSTNTANVTVSNLVPPSGDAVTIGGPGTFTLGAIATKGSAGVYIDGPGTVNLAGALNLSSNALQISGGTAKLASGFGFSTERPVRIAAGGTLDLNGIVFPDLDFLSDINGAGGIVTNSNAAMVNLTMTNTSSTNNSTQTFSGAITGNINFVENVATNTIAQVLAGHSTYTGSTTISGGYMRIGTNNALPTSTALAINEGKADLDLNGYDQTVGSLAGTAATGTPTIYNSAVGTNSILTVNGSGATTFAGVIEDNNTTVNTPGTAGPGGPGTAGGTVGLQINSGVLTLTGSNTYSGGTTINGGTLRADTIIANATGSGPVTVNNGGTLAGQGRIAGAVTVNAGGHLDPGDGGLGEPLLNSLTLNGSSVLDYNFNNTTSNEVSTGTLMLGGASGASTGNSAGVGINVYASGTTGKFAPSGTSGSATYDIFEFSGTAPATNTLSVLNPVSVDSYAFGISGSDVTLTITYPKPITWTGTVGNHDWNNINNWSPNTVPNTGGVGVIFGSSSDNTVSINTNQTVGSISFTAGSYTIQQGGGGTLNLANGGAFASITSSNGASNSITAPITLSDSTIITANNSSDQITLAGNVSGAGGIITGIGGGTISLFGNNSYQGGTTIASLVNINSATSLGASTGAATIGNATLAVTNSGIVESRNFSLGSANSSIQINPTNGTYEIDGNISNQSVALPGTLNLLTPNGGTLILTGNNTYSGGTAIPSNGTVQLGNGTIGGSIGTGPVALNGTINANLGTSGAASIPGAITGGGAINQTGGTLTLSGNNTNLTGPVSVTNGKLVMGNATFPTGNGTLTLTNSTLSENTSATLGGNITTFNSLNVFGNNFIDTGPGDMTLSTQITGDATTSITRNAGTGNLMIGIAGNKTFTNINFAGAFTSTIGSVSILSSTTGTGGGNAAWTFSSPGGTGTLTLPVTGTGTVSFGSLAGNDNIAGGIATSGDRISAGNLANSNVIYSGLIGSANASEVGVLKVGATSTWTLSGQNLYSGLALTNAAGAPTAVAAGTLIAGSSTSADGTNGPFGPAANNVLLGNNAALNTASLLTGGAVTVANPVYVSGGSGNATTTAYTLSVGGNAASISTFSGAVILENNLTVSQVAGGTVNLTGGVSGTGPFTGPGTTTITDPVSNNNMGLQTVTFAGPGAMNISTTPISDGTFDSGGGPPQGVSVLTTGGTTTFSVTNTYSGATTVDGGTLALSAAQTSTPNISVAVGTLKLLPHAPINSVSSNGWINTSTLYLAAGGAPDVTTNTVVFDTTVVPPSSVTNPAGGNPSTPTTITITPTGHDATTLRQALVNGYDKGAWDGANAPNAGAPIILTSSSSLRGTTLGYLVNGATYGANTFEVKYTWYGDLNLDGVVNGSDLAAMTSGNGTSWAQGDLNYDGVKNADDWSLFELGTAVGGTNISTRAPEPTLVLPALLAPLAVRRRRRR